MKILEDRNDSGWITAVIDGRWVEAKVYDKPSLSGIYNGRVSKLYIAKTDTRDPKVNYFEQMDYGYDRGIEDHNHLPDSVIRSIVRQLEEHVTGGKASVDLSPSTEDNVHTKTNDGKKSMKTFTFTEAELEELKTALAFRNDVLVDTALDDTPLYSIGESDLTMTPDEIRETRNKIYKMTERLATMRVLLSKFGLEVDKDGYTV